MLRASNITIQFDTKPLFENVSVKFSNGHRYGLIGANGAGKSTFMKILSGELLPTSGSVSLSDDEQLGVLKQDQFAFEKERVIDTVMMGDQALWPIAKERNHLYSLPEMSEAEGIKVAELEMQFAELDGYTAESRAGELLLGLDISELSHFELMSALPPALKLRVLLAQVLFARPSVFLLDEPTNNLDINTIRWLENVLNQSKATMIIISHDRHFLNSVCTHIADLDYGNIHLYPGNYDTFMLASVQKRQQTLADNEKKQVQIEQLEAFVRRFSANASKAKQATSRARQIEKITLEEMRPSSRKSPYIKFVQDKTLHRNALSVKSLSKQFGNASIFKDITFTISAGQKVAIIGDTGIGKTTLLRCIVGDCKSDDPNVSIRFAEQANIGYFPQDHTDEFISDKTLYAYLYGFKKINHDEHTVRGALGRMLFSGDDSKKPLNKLSGGEKVRLLLAKFTLQDPNILILDEPTNHLDMESIEALNIALAAYQGSVIFVSHDREFVSSIATRIIEMTTDGMRDFSGTYDDYMLKMQP